MGKRSGLIGVGAIGILIVLVGVYQNCTNLNITWDAQVQAVEAVIPKPKSNGGGYTGINYFLQYDVSSACNGSNIRSVIRYQDEHAYLEKLNCERSNGIQITNNITWTADFKGILYEGVTYRHVPDFDISQIDTAAVTTYASPGVYTWVNQALGTRVKVECWGAGGGGGQGGGSGNKGGGGGGGGYFSQIFDRQTIGSNIPITVGSGGLGGASFDAQYPGAKGGSSSFGVTTASGGGGGIQISLGGAGGEGGVGQTANGQPGLLSTGGTAGGHGGGAGAVAPNSDGADGISGSAPGGGGSGSVGAGGGGVSGNQGGLGGRGGDGRCIVSYLP